MRVVKGVVVVAEHLSVDISAFFHGNLSGKEVEQRVFEHTVFSEARKSRCQKHEGPVLRLLPAIRCYRLLSEQNQEQGWRKKERESNPILNKERGRGRVSPSCRSALMQHVFGPKISLELHHPLCGILLSPPLPFGLGCLCE